MYSVFVASICSENETPAKAKRGLNKIYIKLRENDTHKETIEDIFKTVEINGIGMVYRRMCNPSQPIQIKCLSLLSVTK
jgi:hypothetical protein